MAFTAFFERRGKRESQFFRNLKLGREHRFDHDDTPRNYIKTQQIARGQRKRSKSRKMEGSEKEAAWLCRSASCMISNRIFSYVLLCQ